MTRDIAPNRDLVHRTLKGASAMSKTILATAADSGFRTAPAAKQAAMTPASSRHRRAGGPARPENHVIALFGATGDLARRKLLPGLFHLAAAGLMPDGYQIIGSSRRNLTDEQFRDLARQTIAKFGISKSTGAAWQAFQETLSFRQRGTRRRRTAGRGHRAGRAGDRRPSTPISSSPYPRMPPGIRKLCGARHAVVPNSGRFRTHVYAYISMLTRVEWASTSRSRPAFFGTLSSQIE
jgi:hypothetical protein